MEKRHNVKLTTSTSFELEQSEIKQLYIYLSLFQHRYMRIPNYPERPLIEALERDFRRFYQEMLTLTKQDPNNLTLNKMRAFFEMHCKYLKGLSEHYKEQTRLAQ
ncbi:MAG: hypothetical protein SNJ33_02395 [Rikenellaceae bacterium]